jgi:hypothetical protein
MENLQISLGASIEKCPEALRKIIVEEVTRGRKPSPKSRGPHFLAIQMAARVLGFDPTDPRNQKGIERKIQENMSTIRAAIREKMEEIYRKSKK